jgi:BASS family bile acid:Na+ symporter
MDAAAVDQVRLNFSPGTLTALNVVIGLMMFGMAIDMKAEDFARVLRAPKGPLIGLLAQFVLLPAFTFLLTLVLPVQPSIALGMMLVAACPGGNLSNLLTYLARGNTALSVSMTAVSSVVAIVMTPLNVSLWGALNPKTQALLHEVSLSPADVLGTIVLILGLPMVAGIGVSRLVPGLADKVRRPVKVFSMIFFLFVFAFALKANWDYFVSYVGVIFFAVVLHNALALSVGYGSAALFGLPRRDRRAVCIEVGIQNSALALVLIFDFFDGLGGMAIIAGLWGIWHIVSGLLLATAFNGFQLGADPEEAPEEAPA